MRSSKKVLEIAPHQLQDFDPKPQSVENDSKLEFFTRYDFEKKQKNKTKIFNNRLDNHQLVNLNKIVETFFIALLLLFSALEEADWLCFSANNRCEDLVEDDSTWNIYKLFSFLKFYNNYEH